MSSKKLICRHCQGDHLSLQCPTRKKNKAPVVLNFNKQKDNEKRFIPKSQKLLVKMYPLPDDLHKKELINLLSQWGPVGKVYLKKERETYLQVATIEFLKKSQGLKAIYQLNDTNFDYLKIKVEELTSKNY